MVANATYDVPTLLCVQESTETYSDNCSSHVPRTTKLSITSKRFGYVGGGIITRMADSAITTAYVGGRFGMTRTTCKFLSKRKS